MAKGKSKVLLNIVADEPEIMSTVRSAKNNYRLIIITFVLLSLATLLHLTIFSDLNIILQTKNKVLFFKELNIRIIELCCLLATIIIILILLIKLIKNKWVGLLLNFILWGLIFLYSGEIWSCLYPPSQGNKEAYISQIWFKKYWVRNKYGFRDREFNFLNIANADIILDLGDSYVAGHGIKDPEDRTSNILQKLVLKKYYVINAGTNGAGTREEFELLKQFPLKPKYIFLSHVTNDIEEILPKEETYTSIYRNSKSGFSDFVHDHSRNSVFLDLIYHLIKNFQFGEKVKLSENKNVKLSQYEWYMEDSIYRIHLSDIQKMINYMKDTLGSKIIFISYPECGKNVMDSSDLYVNQKIEKALIPDENLHFLNTTVFFKKLTVSERQVNMLNGHPSKKINRMVADSLYKIILTAPL